MKRSAIVWDYSAQTLLVEERYAAYAAHQAESHSSASADDEEPTEATPRPLVRPRHVSRSTLSNIGVGLAVLAVVLVLLFLHVA